METTASWARGKDLWGKFCKIETTQGLMSAVIYALHFSGETARPYIKERLQKSFTLASARAEIILSLRLALLTTVRDSAICELLSNEK